jgi:hypothetical protein
MMSMSFPDPPDSMWQETYGPYTPGPALTEDRTVIADPVQAFTGRLDVPELQEDGQSCRITISYESRLIDLSVPRNWRYTHESQQVLHPGDRGFEHVTAIQDQEITWGRG